MEAALEAASRVELLVRCQHDRAVAQETKRLFEHLEAQPIRGYMKVEVPRKPGQKKRLAKLSLRYAPVELPSRPSRIHALRRLREWPANIFANAWSKRMPARDSGTATDPDSDSLSGATTATP